MECAEARRLLDAGVEPGSTDPRRAALGFHLAGCAGCKAYAARPSDETLLLALLDEQPAEARPAPPRSRRPAPPRPAPLARRWRLALYGGLALLLLLVGAGAVRVGVAAYTITSNLQAMQVTTPVAAPTPALSVPTAPPLPTATPRPAAGVIDAPAPPAGPSAAPDGGATDEAARPTAAPAGALASVTPVRLPPVGGPGALPTLMPTVGVPRELAAGEPVTVLLLGSDRRPGESWQTRSDAIMVVRLDPARQRVALLSLPRDLIVAIPGVGQYRINAATVYGEMYPELGGGVELARKTVSNLLGLPIDYVVRADFTAFIKAVDAIGGVEIDVQQELYDPLYPTMDYGYMEVYFPVGKQRMDGERALIYSRVRHGDSNYARNRRQQEVILAILRRVREENVLNQVQMVADLSTALRDDIQTDLSLDEMLGLAWAFRGAAPETVERYALDETMVYEGGIIGDPYATLPVAGAIESLADKLVNGEAEGE
jgi:LCP family protein required for cell wall assembly